MSLPLEKIKVLDLSRMLPGPYCSMILSDLGAEIIRVENRKYPYSSPPPFYQIGKYRESAFNSILMRNKKSISLNLKKAQAREIFYQLVKQSDVVLETFRPKVVDKLQIDYETLAQLNPSIIYCSLTGYGQTGPYEQLPGHDMNYLGICGIMDLNRERTIYGEEKQKQKPVVPGMQCADIGGALVSAIGILGAIIERSNNPRGEGQYIDVSMLGSAFSFMPMAAAYYFAHQINAKVRTENPLHGKMPYYQVYKTKDDKYLTIGAIEKKFWDEMCRGLNREDLIIKQNCKDEEREDIFGELRREFQKKTQKEWMEIFKEYDTCIMPVKSFGEACNDPQIVARNMVVEQDHPKLGKIPNINSPIKYSRTPLKIRKLAPKVGEHTKSVLKELGYSDEEIKQFKKGNVI